jgi:hypothetical protein
MKRILNLNGGRIKDNLSIVQNNGKWSKVVYSEENAPPYLIGVRFVSEQQLSRLPILKKTFEISKLVERECWWRGTRQLMYWLNNHLVVAMLILLYSI